MPVETKSKQHMIDNIPIRQDIKTKWLNINQGTRYQISKDIPNKGYINEWYNQLPTREINWE